MTGEMERLKKYNQQLKIMIYILDDEKDVVEVLEKIFKEEGIDNHKLFTKASEFIENLNESVRICILDYILPEGMYGIDVLRKVKAVNENCYCIGIMGQPDLKKIMDWVNAGLQVVLNKNDPNYLKDLTTYVKDAIARIKKDYEWHGSLLTKIQAYEQKLKSYEEKVK